MSCQSFMDTAQKMKFSIKDFFSKCETADLVTLTEEIPNGKLPFLCSGSKVIALIKLGESPELLFLELGVHASKEFFPCTACWASSFTLPT